MTMPTAKNKITIFETKITISLFINSPLNALFENGFLYIMVFNIYLIYITIYNHYIRRARPKFGKRAPHLKQARANLTSFSFADFSHSCVKILVNPKGLTAFYALPTQKSVCFKLPAPKMVSARMNFCFWACSRANARQGRKCEKPPRRPILGILCSAPDCFALKNQRNG